MTCDTFITHTYWFYIVRIKNTNDTRIEKKKSRTRSERDDDDFAVVVFVVVVNRIAPVITKNKRIWI